MSGFLKLNKADLQKILKGAAMATVGALGTYAIKELSGHDFGQWNLLVAAGLSVAANALHKLTTDGSSPNVWVGPEAPKP